jgi:hypothetical protein
MPLITLGASGLRDAWHTALEEAAALRADHCGIVGYGVAELIGDDGRHKQLSPFANLITDAGDLYYATKAIVGISPANGTAPTAVNGMKLGTATTAAGKTTIGAASLAASADYITGSNIVFDSTFPSTSNLGAGAGVNAVYKTTWAAGVATNATINSVVIVNDQATNATTSVANTISRAVISTVNKTASDTLAITWNHKFLGA